MRPADLLPLIMDGLLYFAARSMVACLQLLPLDWAAQLGRVFGSIAYWLDRRHRRVARSSKHPNHCGPTEVPVQRGAVSAPDVFA